MLDIGWSEMAIIAVVALFVIGPKDLPKVLGTIGRYAGKVKAMAREFQDTIDEAVREADLDEVKKQIEKVGRLDVKKSISDTIDPEGKIGKALDFKGFPQTSKSGGDRRADGESAADAAAEAPAEPAAAANGGNSQEKEASAAAASSAAAPERESSAGA
jgi:sec-independent protein translocase protein TatB